jgi:hypothetical protein
MEASCEDLAVTVAHLDRDSLVLMLQRMECTFPMDFTDEFLRTVNVERLRHIVLSASLHTRKGMSL